MPFQELVDEIEIVAGCGTTNLSVQEPYTLYNIISSGTVTVGTNNTISASGTPEEGPTFLFHYIADVASTSTADVIVFGYIYGCWR